MVSDAGVVCSAGSPSLRQDCDTATTTTSVDGSPTKELTPASLGMQLPVDEEDYLQPQMTRTSPIYLDLIDPTLPTSAQSSVKHRGLSASVTKVQTIRLL